MTPCDEYAGLEDADEFGVNLPDVNDLPAPRDVLAGEQEPMPNWLRDCRRLDGNVLEVMRRRRLLEVNNF